jgi:hypothetical protein
MNLAASFEVTAGDRSVRLRPLTVRERMRLNNDLIERERRKAIELGKACGMAPREISQAVSEAVSDAEKMSALVMWCFTLEGAMAILLLSCAVPEDADYLGSNLEPAKLGAIAAKCLNVQIDTDSEEKTDTDAGN